MLTSSSLGPEFAPYVPVLKAERLYDEHLLACVGAVLNPLDMELSLSQLAEVLVEHLGDFCVVFPAKDEDTLRRAGMACRRPEDREWAATIKRLNDALPDAHPALQCFRQRQTMRFDFRPADYPVYAQNDAHREVIEKSAPRYGLTVPLLLEEECLGVIALSSRQQPYEEEDVALVEEVARRTVLFIENARLRTQQLQATRMREEVLSIVAHDLRNPLATILIQAQRLRRQSVLSPEQMAKVGDLIWRAGSRMERMIEDLLDVAALDAGRLVVNSEAVNVRELLEEVWRNHQEAFDTKKLMWTLDISSDLPRVWADRTRVMQVLDNLVSNALKFTAQGHVILGARAESGRVTFWVKDTGVGVAEEHQSHLFERFWRASKGTKTGMGLGLPISRGLVEAQGGKMGFHSQLGMGSTFYFSLPVCQ